jgi:two-component system sensor histidine kinase PilS (NtrC family)
VSNAATPAQSAIAEQAAAELRWRLLRLLNLFRAFAAALLLLLFLVDEPPRIVGADAAGPFVITVLLWFSAALGFAALLGRRVPGVTTQTLLQLGVDLVAVLLLVQWSGGVTSGLGGLLIVSVLAASLLLDERYALLFAASATLALLFQQALATLEGVGGGEWTPAALLGGIFLGSALLGSRLTRRAFESEVLAIQRGADLARLAQLNDQVLQYLETGVLVIDEDGHLSQINAAAVAHLGITARARGLPVAASSPRLAALLEAWREAPTLVPGAFASAVDGRALVPHLRPLGAVGQRSTLVFLEDPRLQAARVQDVKLAALGRLTASIAHEIRNPLAALSHANQLLEESERIGDEERRFTSIIASHVARVDGIIESVLALGRRGSARPEALELGGFVRDTVAEFSAAQPAARVALELPPGPVAARLDPTHLRQVLVNLLDNALRHGVGSDPGRSITVRCIRAGQETALEVEDDGPGMSPELALHAFEPFHSGNPRGTGLGLFIARELLAANRATLDYAPGARGGACFRITLPDPARWLT